MERTGRIRRWLLLGAAVVLAACGGDKKKEEPVETLPTISIGDGSRTNAHRALKAASELSVVSDAWLEFSGEQGESIRVRLVSLDTQRREPMFGWVDYPFVELAGDRVIVGAELVDPEEVNQYLQRVGASARAAQSEARVALGTDDRSSGKRLVELLRQLSAAGINHILASGADVSAVTKEQIEDPDNAPPLR